MYGRRSARLNGGDHPRWRADGKELFYQAADGTLMSVAVNTQSGFKPGTPVALFKPVLRSFPGCQYDVMPDGKHFLLNSALSEGSAEPITMVANRTAEVKK